MEPAAEFPGQPKASAPAPAETPAPEVKSEVKPVQETAHPAAPVHTADVKVPAGPFKVKNCKTGQMNLFQQTADHSLVLKDKGKTLWMTTFHDPICGRVGEIDYYANGKIQFAFCAGSKLYVIDRLGRFVKTFPKDLGKDVLLGPDLYDFNGQKIYNLLVLHKDNTVQMYNMKGQKPASWKGITAPDTILDLPERVSVGGKTFWVLPTAGGKLIYPFYGGTPVRTPQPIAAGSPVKVLNSTSVQVEDAQGRPMTVKLR